ncbi:DUF5995 family protein [Kitasatospora sp. NPDC089913]|uniref:DUF5995 family protein n=1 Tax=Kitasatospora sp. NPDC089913 TaxID=3364080 RepID=UPI0038078566
MGTEPAPAPIGQLPDSVNGAIQRMKQLDAELDARDGVAAFNRMYLRVTELVGAKLTDGFFQDSAFIERMDVIFAGLFLRNVDAAKAGRPVNPAWQPLIDARHRGDAIWPIQFAFAGMTAHIGHDLALAVILTCEERHTKPNTPPVHADYQKVNQLLSQVEAEVRAAFEPELLKLATADAEALKHLLASFSMEAARDAAWIAVQGLWAQKKDPIAIPGFGPSCQALAASVGLTALALLAPVVPPVD